LTASWPWDEGNLLFVDALAMQLAVTLTRRRSPARARGACARRLARAGAGRRALSRADRTRGGGSESRALAFIADASSILAGTLDAEGSLLDVARLAVSRVADGFAVDLVDGEAVRRIAYAGDAPEEELTHLLDRVVPSVLQSGDCVIANRASTASVPRTSGQGSAGTPSRGSSASPFDRTPACSAR